MMLDFLGRIFARRQVAPPPNEQRHRVVAWPRQSDAGLYVTDEIAPTELTAWACGSLIARTGAMLPPRVMAARGPEEADGNQRLIGHPVEGLFGRAANPEQTAFQVREGMLLEAIFKGNAFAEIERSGDGRPIALWPIHTNRVAVCRTHTGDLYYEVDNGNSRIDVAAQDIFHLAAPSFCGPVGMSLISQARQSLGLALAQQRFAGNFIRNQAAPSGLVKLKNTITPVGFERLRAKFEELYKGPRQAGKVIFGDADWDWQQIGVSPQDAEFLAQRRFSVEEVARWFGVPPQMIGDTSKQTFANFEQAGLNFLTLAILPWVVRIEQEANRKLFAPAIGRRPQPFLKLNTSAIVRADLEKRN